MYLLLIIFSFVFALFFMPAESDFESYYELLLKKKNKVMAIELDNLRSEHQKSKIRTCCDIIITMIMHLHCNLLCVSSACSLARLCLALSARSLLQCSAQDIYSGGWILHAFSAVYTVYT